MSMIGCFRRLPAADLDRLMAKPDLIGDYLYEDESPGFGPFADLHIDKAWHGIHFLLTGSAWEGDPPLDFICQGGAKVGEEDVGYGAARAFCPEEVAAIASAITVVSREELESRFDPNALSREDVYPAIWESEGLAAFEYLGEYFEMLVKFLTDAAKAGEALLVWVC